MEALAEIVDILRDEGAVLRDTPWGPVAVDFGDWEAEYRAFRQGAGLFRPPSVAQVEITRQPEGRIPQPALHQQARSDPARRGVRDIPCRRQRPDPAPCVCLRRTGFAGPAHRGRPGTKPLFPSGLLPDPRGRAAPRSQLAVGRVDPRRAAMRPKSCSGCTACEPARLADEYLLPISASQWNGRPLMVRRLQERGFQNFHLAGEAADMGPLWQALRQLGATACGMRALETVRIEEGFPVIGLDITEKTLPQEVGRNEKAISLRPRAAIWDRKLSPASTAAARSTRSFREFASQNGRRSDLPAAN